MATEQCNQSDQSNQATADRIRDQITNNPIVLYMKGSPQQPMCGFSARTVQVLASYGHKFAFVNILANQDIRTTLPSVSNWPTFPQLFVHGELVGGCDLVEQMHESGELSALLEGDKTPNE